MRAVVSTCLIAGSVPKPAANELAGEATTIVNLADADDGRRPFSVQTRRSSARAHCTGSSARRALSSVMRTMELLAVSALASSAVAREEAAADSLRKVRRLG